MILRNISDDTRRPILSHLTVLASRVVVKTLDGNDQDHAQSTGHGDCDLAQPAVRGEVVKEAYTVEEVAKKTKLSKFTIRQACNKGRIKEAYKGKDGAWRITHASLLEILNYGLPPE